MNGADRWDNRSLAFAERVFISIFNTMKRYDTQRVPVIPLGLVLLPRMPLPLHIFEERYRQIIARCIDDDIPFGVLLHTGGTIQTTGCLAMIDSVINTYNDGRMDILAVGTDRFAVREMHDEKPYIEADITVFEDDPLESEAADEIYRLAQGAMDDLQAFAEVAGYTLDKELLDNLAPQELSFFLATTDVFSTEEKQQLLELTSTPDRMLRASRAIGDSRVRLSMAQRIREVLGKENDEDIIHLFN